MGGPQPLILTVPLGCWAVHRDTEHPPSLLLSPGCLLLCASVVHTYAQENSFSPLLAVSSCPQTHASLYPPAPLPALSFLKKLHKLVPDLLCPLSLPAFSIWHPSVCRGPSRRPHSCIFAGQKSEWVNKWFKAVWAIRKVPVASWCSLCTSDFSLIVKATWSKTEHL